MLDVFFTVDVEVWCDEWHDIDAQFAHAFKKYIYGPTHRGDYGLAYQLKVLNDHGLTGVCFVEPLFATHFGLDPLAEVVGLIQESGHQVELHLHTEWVDEAREPLLPQAYGKRQYMRAYSQAEQSLLIAKGLELLGRADARPVSAFRAGSFGFNVETLRALAENGIGIDSSYNAVLFGRDSGVMPGVFVVEPIACEGVFEFPLTVFKDGMGALRHAQLTACSYSELEYLLWQALERGSQAVVMLSHNFELLDVSKTKADPVVVKRFLSLCGLLARNPDCFRVRGFRDLDFPVPARQPAPLEMPFWKTAGRIAAQAYRRVAA